MPNFDELLRAHELWVWVTEDPPGTVGVLAGGVESQVGVQFMATFMGSTRKAAERFRPVVEGTVRQTGKTAHLVRFEFAHEEDVIHGSGKPQAGPWKIV